MTQGDFFRKPLREQINLKHPLVRLADLINWDRLSMVMIESFVSRKRRLATSPRLIAGLLYLQPAFDLSDEEEWVEIPTGCAGRPTRWIFAFRRKQSMVVKLCSRRSPNGH